MKRLQDLVKVKGVHSQLRSEINLLCCGQNTKSRQNRVQQMLHCKVEIYMKRCQHENLTQDVTGFRRKLITNLVNT